MRPLKSNELEEKHLILKAGSAEELNRRMKEALEANPGFLPVFRRYFLSDKDQAFGIATAQIGETLAAQRSLDDAKAAFMSTPEANAELEEAWMAYAAAARAYDAANLLSLQNGATSMIVQPPLDGSAVAAWMWLVSGAEVDTRPGCSIVREGGREHYWSSSLSAGSGDSAAQTRGILLGYEENLCAKNMDFAQNCVRTWFFVHDIDNNYAGMVRARRENFETVGLTPKTHYIASTGIAGTSIVRDALVQMDAYAIDGKFTQKYLYAPTHLNPTYEYGVTFERGVRLDMDGRRRVMISGTASIDNKGAVLHVGDVCAQTGRMLENVETLLAEAGCGWKDVKQALVYLRNASDYEKVAPIISERLCGIPYVIMLAPVCRPDWLIEMECIAF